MKNVSAFPDRPATKENKIKIFDTNFIFQKDTEEKKVNMEALVFFVHYDTAICVWAFKALRRFFVLIFPKIFENNTFRNIKHFLLPF